MNDLLYLKYNLIPNYIAFNIIQDYYNNNINMSFIGYYNKIMKYINVNNLEYEDIYRIVFNTLVNKYSLLIINIDKLEIRELKK